MAAGCLQEWSGAPEAGERTALSDRGKPYKGPAAAVPTADNARHAAGIAKGEKNRSSILGKWYHGALLYSRLFIKVLISFQKIMGTLSGGKREENLGRYLGIVILGIHKLQTHWSLKRTPYAFATYEQIALFLLFNPTGPGTSQKKI